MTVPHMIILGTYMSCDREIKCSIIWNICSLNHSLGHIGQIILTTKNCADLKILS